jgi:hypothetical protein
MAMHAGVPRSSHVHDSSWTRLWLDLRSGRSREPLLRQLEDISPVMLLNLNRLR